MIRIRMLRDPTVAGPQRKHWLVAAALAVLVHAGAMLAYALAPHETVPETRAPGITVTLAAAPAPEPNHPPPTPDQHQPAAKPQPAPEPEPPPKPTPAPKPEPAPKPRPETPPLRQPRSAQPPEKRPNLARATREFAPARQDRTGEISDAPPSYQKALRRALARHKHYPWQARRRHQQGVVELYFVINRQGRVLEWQLRASSGFALLDQAVKKMIRNADLPPFPESMHISRMQVSIPVQFQLRRD